MVDLDSDTKGVEVYIIQELFRGAGGMNFSKGLAVSPYGSAGKKSNRYIARTIAHEIGHAAGLKDIYDIIELVDGTIVRVPNNTMPSNELMPGDCNAGTSFYDTYGDTYRYCNILRRLLMYGYGSIDNEGVNIEIEKYDIPRKTIFGVGKDGAGGYTQKQIDVGLENMYVVRDGRLYHRDPMHE